MGIVLPSEFVKEKGLKPNEEIVMEYKGKSGTVLKELFGAIKFSKPTKQLLKEARKELESKFDKK